MLHHPDGADRVERAVVDVPVVLKPDLETVGKTRVGDPPPGQVCLVRRVGDADPLDSVVPGGVDQQAAPAAAYIEQSHSGTQTQLGADQLVLGILGRREPHVGRCPQPARVRHRRTENLPIEGVGQIVVMGDGSGIPRPAVAAAPRPRLGRGWWWGQGAQQAQQRRRRAQHGRRQGLDPKVAPQVKGVENVAFDVELTGHIRPRETEFTGTEQHPPHCLRRLHDNLGRGFGPDGRPVPQFDSYRWFRPDETRQQIDHDTGHGGCAHAGPRTSGCGHTGPGRVSSRHCSVTQAHEHLLADRVRCGGNPLAARSAHRHHRCRSRLRPVTAACRDATPVWGQVFGCGQVLGWVRS